MALRETQSGVDERLETKVLDTGSKRLIRIGPYYYVRV